MKKKITVIAIVMILISVIVIGIVKTAKGDYMTSVAKDNKATASELMVEDSKNSLSDAESKLSLTPSTDAGGDVATDAGSGSGLTNDRKLVKTVRISAETLEFDKTVGAIKSEIEKCGGYIESSDITGSGYDEQNLRNATFTVRIPADKTEAFTGGVGELCNVIRKSEAMRDETANYLDIESHLKALRAEEASLLVLLEKAESVDNIISLQNRLSEVIYQIESYESSLRKIDGLVSFSTVDISLYEVEKETPVVTHERTWGEKMADAFTTALSDMGDSVKNFAIVFMGMLPKLIVFAVIVVIAVIIISVICKKFAKNRKTKKLKNSVVSDDESKNDDKNTEEKE